MTSMAEPEWDDATRELVLALDAMPRCTVCGGPSELCQDPEREFDWVAGKPVRCHATTALLLAQKGVTEETNPAVRALMWPVVLRDELERTSSG